MSFENASVTKGLIIFSATSSVCFGIFDLKHYLHLQFVPHISTYHQYWRLFIHHLAFSNSSDLLLAVLLLYNVGIHIERQFGSVKYASFVFMSLLLATLLEFVTLMLFNRVGINKFATGPSALIFCILYQYSRIVPPSYMFKVFGWTFTNKSFSYLLALQMAISRLPSSAVVAIIGLLTGQLYRSDLAGFNTYRLPPSVVQFSRRYLSPVIGSLHPPRRSNRALPDGSRGDGSQNRQGIRLNEEVITTARRRRSTTPRIPLPTTTTTNQGLPSEGLTEWVGDLVERTGSARVGLRIPTDAEISTAVGMFPTIEREVVIGVLQRRYFPVRHILIEVLRLTIYFIQPKCRSCD
ncbi:Rhomboid-like protein 20 [Psilocybe cubensis]|uniref:Rhomboid-like protein 20 n=2 Tax=Psilocybe cubensis TaxID=181762 RepID=A0ACB8H3D9_PSICU|nr:Rhomboid-like protein 20 [Psilocybe cubensis]KAH9482308.1 Rhomboid-like protein 20 [Psilocybe cubensis]